MSSARRPTRIPDTRRPRRILVVTGASGAGKTTAVRALEARALPGVACFYFDSIGVPSPEEMERTFGFGGGERWQAHATAEWLARLDADPSDATVAVLDGQTRPSFVLDATDRAPNSTLSVVLLDCSSEMRTDRLTGGRGQPELANERMDNWAVYLRGQADALGLPVIDTTDLSAETTADRLEAIVRQLG
jgi:hypothetical protein